MSSLVSHRARAAHRFPAARFHRPVRLQHLGWCAKFHRYFEVAQHSRGAKAAAGQPDAVCVWLGEAGDRREGDGPEQVVGTELVAVDPPSIIDQTFKLDPKGKTVVNKDDKIYQMMSATDYWRLGQDTYDLCVEQDCQYYSSWTVDVEGSGADLTYVWTLKIEGSDQPDKPLVRRFKVGK